MPKLAENPKPKAVRTRLEDVISQPIIFSLCYALWKLQMVKV